MEKVLDNESLLEFRSLVDNARNIVVCIHVGPDGDAVGSALALKHVFTRWGKNVNVVAPNMYPDFLLCLPGAKEIRAYAKHEDVAGPIIAAADLIIIADLCDPSRLMEMGDAVMANAAPKVMIDHHLNPVGFCNMTVSHPEMCATAEVLCHLLWQMGELDNITLDEATCLYAGMMCDTGAFTFNSNRPVIFECVGRLLSCGIDKDAIYRKIFWSWSVARLRMTGYMLYVKLEIIPKLHASVMSLTNEERHMLNIKNGDTEGLVNMPLQISGTKLSIFLSEDTEREGVVKVSLRSVGDVRCDEIASSYFNGGGHRNASGGRLFCSMDEALIFTRETLKNVSGMLK